MLAFLERESLSVRKDYVVGRQLIACTVLRHGRLTASFAGKESLRAAEIACQRAVVSTSKDKRILRCSAPMVGASELAFRLTVRTVGDIDLTWTSMIDADGYVKSESYRREINHFHTDDDCVAQLGGRDPETLIEAARLLARFDAVKAIELNCGCPQRCARKNRYGAFLLDEPDLLCSIISRIRSTLRNTETACAVKVRIYKDEPKRTLDLCRRLASPQCGAQIITVHGRSRDREPHADWDIIRQVKACLPQHVLLIANGDIRSLRHLRLCAAFTDCDAVMTARALLKNPECLTVSRKSRLLSTPNSSAKPPFRAALVYLKWVQTVGAPWQCIQRHLTEFLERPLRSVADAQDIRKSFTSLRSDPSSPAELEPMYTAIRALQKHAHLPVSRQVTFRTTSAAVVSPPPVSLRSASSSNFSIGNCSRDQQPPTPPCLRTCTAVLLSG